LAPEVGGFLDRMANPETLPEWLTEDDDVTAFADQYAPTL
jgi:hypothetical protein